MSADPAAPAPSHNPRSPTFVFEHSLYVGNYVSGILYGISLVLYLGTMQGLVGNKVTRTSPKARRFFAIYSTIMFLLLTADVAVNAIWSQLCWINGRELPGGVLQFIVENTSVWYQTFGSTTVVAMIFMGDALLIYRLYVLWGQNIWVVAFPILAYLAAFSLSICQLVTAAAPKTASLFGGKAVSFGVPYYSITIGLNVLVTLAIFYRLSRLSKTVTRALGSENAKTYTSVASMMVESAAPYAIFGIMFLIPYARQSDTALAFGQVWAKLTCICPQMIVFRVVTGKAWTKETVTQAESTVVFKGNQKGMGSGVDVGGYSNSQGEKTLGGRTVDEKWNSVNKSTKSLHSSNV
ncbi:hypothetical protein BKA70DRAFT_1531879 [Coprinopsis sp. MPI-PUGE-AT-0042]|nr:hypothetical protein BKA70DRAFT_1531879 [Coprinopsis sp. MPI-PUGE-AT-0042]